ncbi:hypothetical protein GGQ73_003803 [Rhizobium skierniewicense]|uniref:HEPN domain-containing protein n=1 Tax=Rhizobium skierniewicense TaxID=984260 RepID=A0A7W6C8V0_9HYPH|nr:hypothetical protein [Rhizobium skierniewicense]
MDAASLILFYAVECALKSLYMLRNNLKTTDEVRAGGKSARGHKHNLDGLIADLRIPQSSIKVRPKIVLTRTRFEGQTPILHEAWRYGEKVDNTAAQFDWLMSIVEWCRNNR